MNNIIRYINTLLYFALLCLMISCGKEFSRITDPYIEKAYDNFNDIKDDTLIHDEPTNLGIATALKRAQQLARISWVPINNVPKCSSDEPFYERFKERLGIPYSLVMHTNTYVGLDVSIYTFLSALKNPYSAIYTEDVSAPPYDGIQCAPFYGTVCSTAVWYALGIDIPYLTKFVPILDFLETPTISKPDSIKLCDILHSSGHMLMVYDIGRNKKFEIEKVTVFECHSESGIDDTKFNIYTFEEFKHRWKHNSWKIYRYKYLDKNIEYDDLDYIYVDPIPNKEFLYNKDICTSRGDMVSYREGDTIIINVLNPSYKYIEIYKNNDLFIKQKIDGCLYTIPNLPYGDYKACLSKRNLKSPFTRFEVINAEVMIEKGQLLKITFNSHNATPQYLDLCNFKQSPQMYYLFSKDDIALKSIVVDKSKYPNSKYCKIYFRGKYGRVSCFPIEI